MDEIVTFKTGLTFQDLRVGEKFVGSLFKLLGDEEKSVHHIGMKIKFADEKDEYGFPKVKNAVNLATGELLTLHPSMPVIRVEIGG